MRSVLWSLLALQGVIAFPHINSDATNDGTLTPIKVKRDETPTQISENESNCGPTPCLVFDPKEQYISTAGAHAYQGPSDDDLRGPCPALNALANHGYISRNGLTTTDEGFASLLAVYAEIISGDIISHSWSIAGRKPFEANHPDAATAPPGISNTHSKFEMDASFSRLDAFANGGDPTPLDTTRFSNAYAVGQDNDRYTLHKLRGVLQSNMADSAKNNANFFLPTFGGAFFTPASYNMIITLMSNHSAAYPSGYLNGYLLRGWFAVSSGAPDAQWYPGSERIPSGSDGWYRRPAVNRYTFANAIDDIRIGAAAFPDTFLVGGNTDGTDTVTDVDFDTLTGGQYTKEAILGSSKSLACFLLGAMLKDLPTQLKGGFNDLSASRQRLRKTMAPMRQHFKCRPLSQHVYDDSAFDPFTGRDYVPEDRP